MFKRILVANRGEIAMRIMRTARRMGIPTVAVYSEADRSAPHVAAADEAVAIGPAPALASYLSIARILDACRACGADAVHPGYGFLSENAAFAEALDAAGITFIGPPVAAIRAMGDKIASKRIAAAAGVRTVPGQAGAVENADEAVRAAAAIGYPVMIKASAGGGGKGMRVAWGDDELREGFQLARSEAASAFADERVFVEKFIENPRHIEIQVLGDAFGNVIHLGERECSIQRRNQKVVEECPSPFLDAATRAAMGGEAVALAKAVGYASAGTVEFIVGPDRDFYFLEMNTRLQVEHPVTELVTGLDLVEAMIRIAAGEPLGLRQADVRFEGWAVEARIYAEDPARGFLPSTGRITRYVPPPLAGPPGATIRLDSGIVEGSEASRFYDPMLAKLCAHGPDREAAVDALAAALDGMAVDGVRTNLAFLSALMAHPRWREGRLSTAFIAEEFPDGFAAAAPEGAERLRLAAIAAAATLADAARLGHAPAERSDWVVVAGDEHLPLTASIAPGSPRAAAIAFAGVDAPIRVESDWRPGERVWRGSLDGTPIVARIERFAHRTRVEQGGRALDARLLTGRAAELDRLMPRQVAEDGSRWLRCPMPGLVVTVAVEAGQAVEAGEMLAVVEAMKMENVLRADRRAIVDKVLVAAGDSLPVDAVILEFR